VSLTSIWKRRVETQFRNIVVIHRLITKYQIRGGYNQRIIDVEPFKLCRLYELSRPHDLVLMVTQPESGATIGSPHACAACNKAWLTCTVVYMTTQKFT